MYGRQTGRTNGDMEDEERHEWWKTGDKILFLFMSMNHAYCNLLNVHILPISDRSSHLK